MDKTMKAVEITHPGGPEVLRLVERPVPGLKEGELLIRVTAAGVNRPDLMQREGRYPAPPGASDIPGLEVAGTVVRAPAGSRFKEGDRLCALVAGGGYAEYCAAPIEQCLPLPKHVQEREAAALPETFFTVWTNVFDRARLRPGESVLVHGATSGIGSTAIQLAKAFGSPVFATAGTAEKCKAAVDLGAVRAINYKEEDFVAAIRTATEGAGVDVVVDIVGGDYLSRNLQTLRTNGRLALIGLLGGSNTNIDLRVVLQKRLTISGSTLRPRTPAEKGVIARELERSVWPLLSEGKVRPIIHAEFPLARASDAHRTLEAGEVIGKVVLVL